MKIALAVLLFSVFCVNCHAQTTTGEEIQSKCKGLLNRVETAAFAGGFCAGFIDGVLNEHSMWEANDISHKRAHEYKFCFPDNITNDQIMKVFVKYLDDHPEELHKPAAVLLVESMEKAFPCQK